MNLSLVRLVASLAIVAAIFETTGCEQRAIPVVQIGTAYATPGLTLDVESAKVEAPDLELEFGAVQKALSAGLVIRLKILNTHDRKVLTFHPGEYFTVEDDAGNPLRGKVFPHDLEGSLEKDAEIIPGKSVTHVEAFSIPAPKTEFLLLRVNLKAFGLDGVAAFQIPKSKIEGFMTQ